MDQFQPVSLLSCLRLGAVFVLGSKTLPLVFARVQALTGVLAGTSMNSHKFGFLRLLILHLSTGQAI